MQLEIDQELDTILLIIGIVYGVCRIVIKSVQQCTYFLFSVNLLLVGVNYGQRTMQVCTETRFIKASIISDSFYG
jgi:hypothetical protein